MPPVSAALQVQVRYEADEDCAFAVATVAGEVDCYTHTELRRHLVDAAERGAASIIVDAAGIEFIDSSGLGVLVGAYKRARRRQGHLLIAAAPDRVTKMLMITGLNRVFGVFDSVPDAVDELHRLATEAGTV